MKFPRLSRALGGSWGINPSAKSVDMSEEEASEPDWVPVSIPKIDHIAANANGEGAPSIFDDHYHFLNTDKPSSGKPTPEQLAVETIRAKVSELNEAIQQGEKLGLTIRLSSRDDWPTTLRPTLTATITKAL